MKRRVLLLFGGRSAEHDVSRVTAVAVARALDPEKYDVVLQEAVYINPKHDITDKVIKALNAAR